MEGVSSFSVLEQSELKLFLFLSAFFIVTLRSCLFVPQQKEEKKQSLLRKWLIIQYSVRNICEELVVFLSLQDFVIAENSCKIKQFFKMSADFLQIWAETCHGTSSEHAISASVHLQGT